MIRPPFFTIIIPLREPNDFFWQCLKACKGQNLSNFKLIILPDHELKELKIKDKRFEVIPTGTVTPAEKRNRGSKAAKSLIYAFLDSDAYPEKNWLERAWFYFHKEEIKVLGGPNLTSPEDNFRQRISGEILASPLVSGKFTGRYRKGNKLTSSWELPSCNLFVRREILEKFGGFDETLLTGEDAKLCFLVRKEGHKVWCAPDLVVYHHRRPIFLSHLKQVWRYALDKARVTKMVWLWSNLYYGLPAVFVLFIILGSAISVSSRIFLLFYLLLISFYLAAVLIFSISKKSFYLFPGIILTHFSYGIGFLVGMFTRGKK